MFPPGTAVNVSYNFMMTSPTVRTVSTFFDIAQFHNNDTELGGSTSPPFEIDLQPNDQMNITIGYLTAITRPSSGPARGKIWWRTPIPDRLSRGQDAADGSSSGGASSSIAKASAIALVSSALDPEPDRHRSGSSRR